nr:TPA_exp: conjugative transposon protein TraE [Elizabethkingia anophelis]DAC75677.1 TPA_exp: conjugative transposon protein TraE [Elizabethkingia anophelis]DAC76058.1 TPA_exp: conjugative transposon protein TraE [Elizabethkingia anophelis]DAC76121.1 TPA_exp: conjugative transposon protein TraE [Elizabethkingia anophelis]DAC76300.1 TPA_exp: conjugative transposon protein TraE [Elizabethkingia anophelis]
MAVGGVVGLIGGVRIYNKWSNGDQDINKEVVGWGGACLFLIIVPQFVSSFFG